MKVQINSQNPQWSRIQYKIQATTGKSSIKILSLYKHNEDITSDHQAIVNLTDFSKQYVAQVFNKTVPLQDIIFYCGHVNIHKYSTPLKVFTFLICKIQLGKIANTTDDVSSSDTILIPLQTQQALQYNYFLRTYSQYEIVYEVSFTFSEDKQFKLSEFQCSNCENRIPTIFCKTQNLFFCDDCCSEHHKTKLMHSHQLEVVDKVNTLGQCRNHNQKFEYFCLKCQKYLCNYCTQKGVHHQSHQHPIKLINYYYEQTKENIEVLPRKYRQKVEALLYNLQVKKKQIQDNIQQQKAFIIASYQKALKDLQTIANEKFQSLNSCEIELKMINDKLEWAKAFAKFQQKTLKPIYFFQSYLMFQKQLSRMKITDFQPIFKVKPDISHDGQIRVGTRQYLQKSRKKALSNHYFVPPTTAIHQNVKQDHSRSRRYVEQDSILSYNPNSTMPRKGQLSLMLQNSKLQFFQVTSK